MRESEKCSLLHLLRANRFSSGLDARSSPGSVQALTLIRKNREWVWEPSRLVGGRNSFRAKHRIEILTHIWSKSFQWCCGASASVDRSHCGPARLLGRLFTATWFSRSMIRETPRSLFSQRSSPRAVTAKFELSTLNSQVHIGQSELFWPLTSIMMRGSCCSGLRLVPTFMDHGELSCPRRCDSWSCETRFPAKYS